MNIHSPAVLTSLSLSMRSSCMLADLLLLLLLLLLVVTLLLLLLLLSAITLLLLLLLPLLMPIGQLWQLLLQGLARQSWLGHQQLPRSTGHQQATPVRCAAAAAMAGVVAVAVLCCKEATCGWQRHVNCSCCKLMALAAAASLPLPALVKPLTRRHSRPLTALQGQK
jgi:hypothetical protein